MSGRRLVKEIKSNADTILQLSDPEKFVKLSEQFGRFCANKDISTSQIRGIFQRVKRLPDSWEEAKVDLHLLRPKLAYQTGRFEELAPLSAVLAHLIKLIDGDDTLHGFKEFFEAILAYHKAEGGK
jgi:CRISPR-associated protein Csm2